jgi:uroporphyrinogen decarboxylase
VAGAVLGGVNQWATLRDGTPEQAVAEVDDAIAQTGGVGLIVGPGCVLPLETPDANVAAVVRKLGGPLKPIPGVKLS